MKKFSIIFLALALSCASLSAKNVLTNKKQKNIIFILTDDLGFNDPSFRGNNEILTPNIDALFYKGINLNRYYTSPLCTPTRSALLTGRYAHRIGMNHEVNWPQQPWGLGLDQKLFSQYLKEVGYSTHVIGKWHLGQHQRQYFPTRRGFDTFYGHLAPYVDYFDRTFQLPESNFLNNNYTRGYDFRNNEEVDRSDLGVYITDLFTKKAIDIIENSNEDPFFIYLAHTAMHRANDDNPLPAKPEDLEYYSFIENPERRQYAAMVKAMDDSIGDLVESLTQSGKMKDTIIVFTTDNGGPTAFRIVHPNTASNYPLRSLKGTSWEGATRVDAAIYAPFLPSGIIRDNYFHVSDWLPTLASLANTGIKFDRQLDGIDLSNMVVDNQGPYRSDIETIDQIYKTTSLIHEDFKLMNSSYAPLMGLVDVWFGSNNNSDREASTYISRVLNSKVATNLKKFNGPLKNKDIVKLRLDLKVTCNDEIVACNVLQKPCLFNIKTDPCERKNLAEDPAYAVILQNLKDRLATALTKIAAPRNRQGDFLSDPSLHGGIWTWWQPDFDI